MILLFNHPPVRAALYYHISAPRPGDEVLRDVVFKLALLPADLSLLACVFTFQCPGT